MPMIIRNNIRYAGGSGGSNGSGENIVELTQAEYDALGDVVNSDNITYYITDSDEQLNASSVVFDDTNTQLGAVNVQGAIEKTNDAINELNSNLPFKLGIDENGNYGYIKDGADSVIPFKKGSTYEYHGIDGKAGLNYDTTNECILILAVYSARKLNTSNYNYEYYELLGNPEEVVQNYFTVTGGQVEELSYRDFSLPGCVKCDDLGEPTLYVACVGIKFFKCTPTEDTMNITVQRVIGEAGMGCFFEKISM